MHKFSENLEATHKILVARRLIWSRFDTDNTKVLDIPEKKNIRRGDLTSAIRASLCGILPPFSLSLYEVVLN
jgi:hypothetical protein